MILLKPFLFQIASSPFGSAIAIFASTYLIWGMLALAIVLAFRSHQTGVLIEAVTAISCVWIIQQIIGLVWFRSRPFINDPTIPNLIHKSGISKSFPSDHAAIAFALSTIIMLVMPWWGKLFYVLALGVAFGRVAVGVHYPTDIVVGATLGVLVALIVHSLYARL